MKKKIIIGSIIGIILIISLTLIITINVLNKNLEELNNLTIENVDLSELSDGDYYGSYSVFPVEVEVKVTVENHLITNIMLIKHVNGQGSDAEVIPDRIIASQSLDVDIVTGATYSSKVILKAIENALNSEPR